jgi:lysozyme
MANANIWDCSRRLKKRTQLILLLQLQLMGSLHMAEIVKCIDISHHQDFPDFTKVKAAGVIAMIHKCTEGSSYVDPNRGKNCKNAIDAGIAVSTYHWLSPGSSPSQQMKFYLDKLQPVQGERVVIDYEENGCTLDDLHEAIQALLSDPRGLQITVYSGHLLKEQLNGNYDKLLAENTDLWLAQYTSGSPSWSEGTYPSWTLWQYSESGTINGISGSYVDLNRFNGSDDELLTWIKPSGSIKPPQPEPEMAAVHFNLNTTGQVEVTIAVNGEVIYGGGAV